MFRSKHQAEKILKEYPSGTLLKLRSASSAVVSIPDIWIEDITTDIVSRSLSKTSTVVKRATIDKESIFMVISIELEFNSQDWSGRILLTMLDKSRKFYMLLTDSPQLFFQKMNA